MNWKNNRMDERRKEVFFSGLGYLLQAGLSFSRSFELLTEGESDRSAKRLYGTLYERVIGGETLWQSLGASPGFSALDAGVVRIGEETGRLDESLQFLSDYYRKQIERRRMVKGAVSYPLVILSVAVAVLVFMLTVIVPMFEQVYGRMGGELPGITRAIITFSGRFPLLLAVTGGALLLGSGAVMLWGRNDDFRLFRGRLLLRLPLAGNLLRKNYEVQFCKLLYLLCSSGIPLLKSITMLEEIITFPPYRFSFRSIARGLQQGELFADNLACFQQLYDRRLIALLRVGEETNRLPEMLRKQGDSLTAELEHRIRQLGNLMEPVLILGIGGIVAFVLISMYLPMFKLGGVVG